jgi:hypothetical protein
MDYIEKEQDWVNNQAGRGKGRAGHTKKPIGTGIVRQDNSIGHLL